MNQTLHVAIIMDGNGRWAQKHNKKRIKGHEYGAKIVRDITKFCASHNQIERLTLYAFSTENWKRPRFEVKFLMKLLEKYLKSELEIYKQNNIRFEPIGDIRAFSQSLQNLIKKVQHETAHCDGLVQSLALNYGSHDEILRAVNSLKHEKKNITDEMMLNALDCKYQVDLMIRTGGDQRISNFLLWQLSYAELFFTDILWPDFTQNELSKILDKFTKRERRFGGLN